MVKNMEHEKFELRWNDKKFSLQRKLSKELRETTSIEQRQQWICGHCKNNGKTEICNYCNIIENITANHEFSRELHESHTIFDLLDSRNNFMQALNSSLLDHK